ncbi:cadmium transporter [Planomonospora sphaerica]|uniref:Cadmium transporter n=1 Tax=Planomonospora sphaerica TaxID=161355 RepID=A0A171D7J0_9ACTN|nr:hypothetical protein [Planomonospora sphaerica]GAT67761.1 cadmium transporter [Planomonospora sphaerica]
MDGLLGTIGTAAAVFAGTNIDDVIVLTVLFLSSRAGGRPRPWQIVAGQYVGIAVLISDPSEAFDRRSDLPGTFDRTEAFDMRPSTGPGVSEDPAGSGGRPPPVRLPYSGRDYGRESIMTWGS